METNTRFLGTTDEVTTCDCCGRTNLKKTIALMVNDFPVYYGSECAAKALGMTTKQVKRQTAKADGERFAARMQALHDASVDAHGPKGNKELAYYLDCEYGRIRTSPLKASAIRFPEGF